MDVVVLIFAEQATVPVLVSLTCCNGYCWISWNMVAQVQVGSRVFHRDMIQLTKKRNTYLVSFTISRCDTQRSTSWT